MWEIVLKDPISHFLYTYGYIWRVWLLLPIWAKLRITQLSNFVMFDILFSCLVSHRARDEAGLQCWKCEDTDAHQGERSEVNFCVICKKKLLLCLYHFSYSITALNYRHIWFLHPVAIKLQTIILYIMCKACVVVCLFSPTATDPSPEELLRQLQEERTCKVCMDKLVSIVFIPCGHLVVCGDCAASLRHCPICRAVIRGSVRAFMS